MSFVVWPLMPRAARPSISVNAGRNPLTRTLGIGDYPELRVWANHHDGIGLPPQTVHVCVAQL
jgi:hypothetical protein